MSSKGGVLQILSNPVTKADRSATSLDKILACLLECSLLFVANYIVSSMAPVVSQLLGIAESWIVRHFT